MANAIPQGATAHDESDERDALERALHQMDGARRRTLELFALADEETLHRSPGFGYRPLLWHLAHIGVFEAYWILQKLKGDPPLDENYERRFDPIATPRDQSKNLPARDEMKEFLNRVHTQVRAYAATLTLDATNPLLRDAYAFDLVIEHELQHQETLAYLLHLLDPKLKRRPQIDDANDASTSNTDVEPATPVHASAMVEVTAGRAIVGAVWGEFAYDNELPAHEVELPAFRISRLLVTNDEYKEFIEANGYAQRELWSDEGWTCREREGWTAPLYWHKEEGEWRARTMFDDEPLAGDHPVCGVSWYEAEAYARFRGARLPTEAEWEKAASWDAATRSKRRFAWGDESPTGELCNYEARVWGTTPVGKYPRGASPYGCLDMTGNVWEWTSDAFAGFDGFAAFPYPEYSEKWFDGEHRVLKGGSWATNARTLRTSFRNFFRRDFRIAFAGIRLATKGQYRLR